MSSEQGGNPISCPVVLQETAKEDLGMPQAVEPKSPPLADNIQPESPPTLHLSAAEEAPVATYFESSLADSTERTEPPPDVAKLNSGQTLEPADIPEAADPEDEIITEPTRPEAPR